jgi:HK97 family phage major capsid protein
MTFEKYLEQRNVLLDEAKAFIAEGKIEESNVKMKEVETLDNQWEEVKLANANLNALKGSTKITDIQNKGVDIVGTVIDSTESVLNDDMFASVEYRKAFMNNVLKGSAIPEKFLNVDANTKTTDIGSVIPTTVLEKIIEKLESTGMILPLVTRTAYKGGMSIPTSTVKPVATWVVEGAGSDKQKKTTGVITFNYYKLRCAVSISLEAGVTSLPVFEATLINNVTEAMIKAIEQAIISGSGVGQPKGVLTEVVVVGQNVDITLAGKPEYQTLIDAEAALPLAYETEALWVMTKKTFMRFIGMVDSQKQPIARVNYGINGRPERTLLGRAVVLVDYMDSLVDAPVATSVVAFLFNFKDYILNTNYNMTLKRYEDNDTDDEVTKAIMLVDGKVVDKNSLVTITKKHA